LSWHKLPLFDSDFYQLKDSFVEALDLYKPMFDYRCMSIRHSKKIFCSILGLAVQVKSVIVQVKPSFVSLPELLSYQYLPPSNPELL
jgi:hypothetical protein